MAEAVRSGERDRYLALVDLTDPVFAVEHTRWADDWSGLHPVREYALELSNLEVSGGSATGTLTASWSFDPAVSGEPPRTAPYAVRFTNGGEGWRYAGEAWTSTEVPHFVIRVAPGFEAMAPAIADDLPVVYGDVTAALGYEPRGTLEIKLYADGTSLVANTLLSLPVIAGWNEPGEALKLAHRVDGPPLAPTIAHELTHFIMFDRAGTQRTRMPWWLDEGVATLVGSYVDASRAELQLAQVVAWEAEGALAPWDAMAVFENTPVELWEFVYPQGYAMARFVTERFGADRRNAWLAAMATDMDIDAATPAELDLTFDELDADFRDWLADQR
jgi:hypothetical protein